ncbi:leucine-rich repeat-containing protein kinase family protein [Shewanella salipaludis]|uniref:Serine/threonine-protein kinase n=1 Tax=Shewanella salipaludis TaxID=2723052 RepID=A0A972G475_9GAMM|nr:leucine-rich repeat-containing protein kinase family protein [Shewanella salipaludis]NMH66914.1 serine/threonine-protein kinase [Shewanella salipaludis]
MQTLAQLRAGRLGRVTRLQLAENLTEFPREIFSLADSLEVLDLSNNGLSSLPDDFDRLQRLKILFLSNNQFEQVPRVLGKCPKLEMIAFKANRIHSLAEGALPERTRWLILTDNKLRQLPESMGKLYRLQKLALAGNELTSLPDTMADCHGLELVRLSANRLTALPDWLLQLPRLAWLAFGGNPLCRPVAGEPVAATVPKVKLADIALTERLGEGASGVIFRGKWRPAVAGLAGAESEIAVKLFKGAVTSDGYPEDELDCCLTAGGHPNLIRVIGQIAEPEQLGLVMELIPDDFSNLGLPPSLASCTRDTFAPGTEFSTAEIAAMARQMAATLAHLHRRGVSHGDVYAHNIMANAAADILFGDFGAASNLAALPAAQRRAMEAIEVRAFGCLLDDLLGQNAGEDRAQRAELQALAQSCMQGQVALRPGFDALADRLQVG